MTLFAAISLFLLLVAVSWLAGFPLRRWLTRAGVLDRPKAHSSHDRPVPRGGGLLVVVAFFGWFFLLSHDAMPGINWLAMGVAAVAFVSFLDDIRHRSRRLRFVVYTLAAAVFVGQLLLLDSVAAWGPTWLVAFVLWLWVAGYANAFNFIDGIDGLAATQAIVALGFGAIFCTLASFSAWELVSLQLVLAAVMMGFLFHNLPRAQLFLGDVGSIATGFLLASIALIAGAELGWKTGLMIAALHLGPVLDTGITLTRRLWQRKVIYDRHREFFFHRAVRSGRSHLFVTAVEMGIQVASGFLLLAFGILWRDSTVALVAMIGVISLAWLAFFFWCERQFRKAGEVTKEFIA